MNTKLNHIRDWIALVREAKWSTLGLAKKCGVSMRTLERHFIKEVHKRPKAWILEKRLLDGLDLLRSGHSVKETADRVGYKNATHFSREFKNHCGHRPTDPRIFTQAGGSNEARFGLKWR
jgi:transcriptional regulator GlxA family with amidase domain